MNRNQTHPDDWEGRGDVDDGPAPVIKQRDPSELKRERMCTAKVRYPGKKNAQTALNSFQKVRGRHGRPESLRAYSCPVCQGWHLTKKHYD